MSTGYSPASANKFPKMQKRGVTSGRGVPTPDTQFSTLSNVTVAKGKGSSYSSKSVGYHCVEGGRSVKLSPPY